MIRIKDITGHEKRTDYKQKRKLKHFFRFLYTSPLFYLVLLTLFVLWLVFVYRYNVVMLYQKAFNLDAFPSYLHRSHFYAGDILGDTNVLTLSKDLMESRMECIGKVGNSVAKKDSIQATVFYYTNWSSLKLKDPIIVNTILRYQTLLDGRWTILVERTAYE